MILIPPFQHMYRSIHLEIPSNVGTYPKVLTRTKTQTLDSQCSHSIFSALSLKKHLLLKSLVTAKDDSELLNLIWSYYILHLIIQKHLFKWAMGIKHVSFPPTLQPPWTSLKKNSFWNDSFQIPHHTVLDSLSFAHQKPFCLTCCAWNTYPRIATLERVLWLSGFEDTALSRTVYVRTSS